MREIRTSGVTRAVDVSWRPRLLYRILGALCVKQNSEGAVALDTPVKPGYDDAEGSNALKPPATAQASRYCSSLPPLLSRPFLELAMRHGPADVVALAES